MPLVPFRVLATRRWSGDKLDNLTHSLVGAAISKVGVERATPLATATLVVAANAPDIDMLSYIGGEYFALTFRRGITHGWPALLVLPFLVTAAMLGWDRWVRRVRRPEAAPARAGPVLALSAVGTATHPALDWMNTYGMRWSLPFDGTWSYGDALFIIDPWIWLTLGGAVFWASRPERRALLGWGVLAALTSSLVFFGVGGWAGVPWILGLAVIIVVRARGRPRPAGRHEGTVAIAALAVVLYIGAMVAASAAARTNTLETAESNGLRVEDILIAPRAGNPFAADVEVQTPEAFVPGTHQWLGAPRVSLRLDEALPRFSASADTPDTLARRVAVAARERPRVLDYLVWSRYPYVRVMPNDSGWAVRFSDARYDSQPAAGGLAGLNVQISSSEIR